jgi:hypothetical protein
MSYYILGILGAPISPMSPNYKLSKEDKCGKSRHLDEPNDLISQN